MITADIYAGVQEALGTSDPVVIFSKITDAVQLLAKKADWNPLIGYVDICCGTDKQTVTLPPDVETPLAVSAGGNPLSMRSSWAEFHINGGGMNGPTSWNWDDSGFYPVFQDLKSPSALVVVAQLQCDLGTPVRVFGLDEMGRVIRTQAPDGSWMDGVLLAAQLVSDFPAGVIRPDPNRYFYRIFSKTPTTEFTAPNHGFVTGAQVVFTLVTAPTPSPLIPGLAYFVGVIDENTIQLFAALQGALTNVNPIALTTVSPATILNLNDERQFQVRTKFTSAIDLHFQQAMQVTFEGSPLPSPITLGEIFYINLIDARNFTIHATSDDANAGINPLFVDSAGANVIASGLQPATPYTKLVFAVNHDFLQGDAVNVSNAGGTLPSPLLPGTDYFVRYIDNKTITLHTSLADATSGQNAIILTDRGAGITSVVKLIQASVSPGTQNNITAANHNLQPGDFIQFQSSGTLPSPLQQNVVYTVGTPSSQNTLTLNSTSKSSSTTATRRRGNNIAVLTTAAAHNLLSGDVVDIQSMTDATYNATQVTITKLDNTSFSYANAGANEGAFITATRCRTNGIAIVSTVASHGLTTGDFVFIEALGGAYSYNGWVQVTVINATMFSYTNVGGNEGGAPTASRSRTSNVATITTSLAHGFSTGDVVNIQGVGAGYDAFGVTVTVSSTTVFTYSNTGANESTVTVTGGYCAKGVTDSNGLVLKGVADTHGVVLYGSINITDIGTGILYLVISRTFTIGFTNGWFTDTTSLSTGAPIQLSTTGTLPAAQPPIAPLTNYYVRVADDFTAYLFPTAAKALDQSARTTVSRARASNVATIVCSAPHGFSTGDYITLTNFTDSTFNAVDVPITVTGTTSFTYLNNGADLATTSDVNGLAVFAPITITGLGSGNYYFALDAAVTVAFLTNGMDVDNALYFNPGTPVTLTTTGTLPAPLQPNTAYTATLDSNNYLTLSLTDGAPITLTSIGAGQHHLNHQLNFSVLIPTEILVVANEYADGDPVMVNTDGTSPAPLVKGTVYYVRRIDDNNIELYDTAAHAIDRSSQDGVQQVLSSGMGIQRLEQYLAATLFLKIERVQLNKRSGFVDMFGWDYARTEDLTQVGHYHPNETDPRYRRIKTLASCCWIRMRYKRRTYVISSDQDYIPLDSGPAIINMVRALKMYDTNFFAEGDRYETLAVKWTKEAHESSKGPEAIQVQFGVGTGDQTADCEREWMD